MRALGQITFPLLLLLALFLGLVVQHFLPPLPGIGARILLMPLVIFYAAVALPLWGMLVMAMCGGLMWDLLHSQQVGEAIAPVVGWSVVLYAVLGALMSGFRPWFLRGRWEVHCLVCALCAAAIPLVEYVVLALNHQPIHFDLSKAFWWRVGGTGLAALIISPFLFFTLNYLGYLLGYEAAHPAEEES